MSVKNNNDVIRHADKIAEEHMIRLVWSLRTTMIGELYARDRKSQYTLTTTGSHQCMLMPTTKYG